MRVRHVEQVVRGLSAPGPSCSLPVDWAGAEVERVRHLPWNGRHEEAHASLGAVAAVAGVIGVPIRPRPRLMSPALMAQLSASDRG